MEICRLVISFAPRSKAKALMLWWDGLLKNIPAMNSNNYTQEGQVEGQVNDQVANDQNVGSQKGDQKKGGLESKSDYFGTVTFKGFEHEVGTENSQYISGKLRLGKLDKELAKVNSADDWRALLDRLIAGRRKKNKGINYSQMNEKELKGVLNNVMRALVGKTNKSVEVICAEMQADWKEIAECVQKLKSYGIQ